MLSGIMRTTTRWFLLFGFCGVVVGCGKGGPDIKTVPVEGKVAFQGGKPLTTGIVVFHPDASKGNTNKHEARGTIDEQGNYKLVSDAGKEGTPPGWYKVSVTSTTKDPKAKDEYAPPKWLIPTRYGDPGASNVAFEVVENPEPGRYNIGILNQ